MSKGLGKGLGALIAMFDEESEAINKGGKAVTARASSVKEVEVTSSAASIEKNEIVPRGTIERAVVSAGGGVQEVDITLLDNNVNQPRKSFDPVQLQELADSISSNGIFQPVLVNRVGSRYLIVAGERRWRAAKLAGLSVIPVLVKEYTPRQIAEIALVENLQRENLNEMELAHGIKKLMDDYLLTQEKVAKVLGKSRSAIANTLRLLNLPLEVQALIETNQLSAGHAKCLAAVSNQDQCIKIAKKCVIDGLSVRDLEDIIRDIGNKSAGQKTTQQRKSPELRKFALELAETFGTKVSIQGNESSGRITFEYYDKRDLERIRNKFFSCHD